MDADKRLPKGPHASAMVARRSALGGRPAWDLRRMRARQKVDEPVRRTPILTATMLVAGGVVLG